MNDILVKLVIATIATADFDFSLQVYEHLIASYNEQISYKIDLKVPCDCSNAVGNVNEI